MYYKIYLYKGSSQAATKITGMFSFVTWKAAAINLCFFLLSLSLFHSLSLTQFHSYTFIFVSHSMEHITVYINFKFKWNSSAST